MPRTLPSLPNHDDAPDVGDVSIPLTIEDLEAGVRLLDDGDFDRRSFWRVNSAAFRRTLVVAIEETSEALSSRQISLAWREELEIQLKLLRHHIEAFDCVTIGRA